MGVRKIAILGTAPSWKDAPFSKKDWEIWTCNRAGMSQKPWHRLFEIHRNWDYENPEARDDYLADLKAVKPPQQVISIVPLGSKANNLVLDRPALFEKYDPFWFSSSFGYMAAHALEQKPTDIGFWGVDLESREEYVSQFAGVRHFIGIAKVLGIKVHIPDGSALARTVSPYADRWETAQAHLLDKKAERCREIIASWEKHVQADTAALSYCMGGLALMRKYKDKFRVIDIADEEMRSARLAGVIQTSRDNLARIQGELSAIRYLQRMFVWNTVLPEGDTGAAGT